MRKRDLQSIPLKLAELKEYDAVKAERALNKSKGSSAEESNSKEPSPIANVGPKTIKEIQDRLNSTMFLAVESNCPIFLLASSLGQKLFQTCDRDDCYERVSDTERKDRFRKEYVEKHDPNSGKVRENRVEHLDSEFVRHINWKELNDKEPKTLETHRKRNENLIVVSDNNAIPDEDSSRLYLLKIDKRENYIDVDRRLDETRKTELLGERNPTVNERKDCSTALRQFNERQNQKFRLNKKIQDLEQGKFQEFRRSYNEERSNRREDLTRRVFNNERCLELSENDEYSRLPLRNLNSLNNCERRSNDRERSTKNRRLVKNFAEERNHVFGKTVDQVFTAVRLPRDRESLRRLSERENQWSRERLPQQDLKNGAATKIEAENQRVNINKIRFANERVFEGELSEHDTLDKYKRQLNKREWFNENRRLSSEETNIQVRDNNPERNHESGLSVERFSDSESLTEERKNLRRLIEPKNQRFSERLSLTDFENESLCNSRHREVNRKSSHFNAQLDKHVQSRSQLNNKQTSTQERERSGHRETLKQLDIRDNRYDMSQRLNERERQNRNTIEHSDKRVRISEINNREPNDRREVLKINNRVNQDDKRENNRALNENEESRRFDERNFENNENAQTRTENEDILTRKLQSNIRQNDKLLQRVGENNRREHNERFNERIDATRNDENINYRDFHYKIDNYIEKPTVFLNRSFVAVGQGAVLAYVILKTLNGKNDIKYNIYQKLQEAVALMGF